MGHGVVDVLAAIRGIAGPAEPSPPHPLPPAAVAVPDSGARRFALLGVAACTALAVGSALVPGHRSPRRVDAVPHEGGTGGAEFGAAR